MKICGYCGKEYTESESKCPVCGSTMLRHNQGAASAAQDYQRLKTEMNQARAKRSKMLGIGAAVLAVVVIIAIASISGAFGNNGGQTIQVPASNEPLVNNQNANNSNQGAGQSNEPVETEPAGPVTVALTDLDVTKQGEYFYVGTNDYDRIYSELYDNLDELCKDVSGNYYDRGGVHFTAYFREHEDGDSYKSITYYLNQEYDVLTGVMYRPYVSLSCNFNWEKSATVEIYGDGSLIWTESVEQNDYDPVNLNVDVSGVRELKIVLKGVWKDVDWDEDYYNPKVCLADMKVTKQP